MGPPPRPPHRHRATQSSEIFRVQTPHSPILISQGIHVEENHPSSQNFHGSQVQDYNPPWLLAQPVTIQNQRTGVTRRTSDIRKNREADETIRFSQEQRRKHHPAPQPSRQYAHPSDEAYTSSVQKPLYNNAPLAQSHTRPDLNPRQPDSKYNQTLECDGMLLIFNEAFHCDPDDEELALDLQSDGKSNSQV